MQKKILPNFLIIGAPRAGTTYIYKNISLHPEIFVSTPKEIHFFDRHYDKGIDYYSGFFKNAAAYKAVGEATPSYLHKEDVASKIKQHLPDVKIIVCLRNPVDRLYSRFWNAKAKYSTNKDFSFEEKIKQKPEFIEEGFYDVHLQRYYSLLPKENFLVLFFDEMITNPAAFLRKIYLFLAVNPNFISPVTNKNVNAAASKKFLSKNVYLYYIQRAVSGIGLKHLSDKIAEKNRTIIPEMSPAIRKWLTQDVYAGHNKNLETMLGVDLKKWYK